MFGTFETPPDSVACRCLDKRDPADEVAARFVRGGKPFDASDVPGGREAARNRDRVGPVRADSETRRLEASGMRRRDQAVPLHDATRALLSRGIADGTVDAEFHAIRDAPEWRETVTVVGTPTSLFEGRHTQVPHFARPHHDQQTLLGMGRGVLLRRLRRHPRRPPHPPFRDRPARRRKLSTP